MSKFKALDREEEFLKINQTLDLETEGLLQQLGDVMKIKDLNNFIALEDRSPRQASDVFKLGGDQALQADNSEVSNAETPEKTHLSNGNQKDDKMLTTTNIGQNITQPSKLNRHKPELRMRDRIDCNIVPDSVKNMGQEGVVRFLKAKVLVLTEQLEIIHKDEKKLTEKVKDLQNERERVSDDRDKWIQQANSAKNLLVKHEQHASDIVMQLQSAQAENGFLKKEVEKLKKELKSATQCSASNEVRLNRVSEENDKLKHSLRQMKQEEKDVKEGQKKKVEELSVALKRNEKQKMELLHAFKKQLVVIDGLKKQRGLAEAGRLLKSIEDDFMEFLDWTPNKT